MKSLIRIVGQELLPKLQMESVDPHDPVVVHHVPEPWEILGVGNYAAVVFHPDYPEQVIKVYAPGRPGWEEEVQVYQKIGRHPAYSECYHAEPPYLILKRLRGVTLYDCIHRGIRIPKQVIRDVDEALEYARNRGLYPHDVHGKNVMLHQNRGIVVDVSDFLKKEPCRKWKDLKKAYFSVYLPIFCRFPLPIPYFLLNGVRKGYRIYRRYFSS